MAIVIPYVKQTWTDGSGGGTPVSAARLGVIEEGILDAGQAPCVRVTHSANQSINNTTWTALNFDTEAFDQAGGAASTMHDTVTNNTRLTCRYAGVYQIFGQASWAANATGERRLRIYLNNTTEINQNEYTNYGAGLTVIMQIGALYALAVNDFIELMGYQASGGALNSLTGTPGSPSFSMVRVG